MSNKRIVIALEFSESHIKLIVGERNEDKLYVYQSFIEPTNGLVNGRIVDEETLLNSLNKIIRETNKKLGISISNVVFALPSDELKILQMQESSKTSNEYTVTDLDIERVRERCRRRNPGNGLSIVEVIPTEYFVAQPPRYDELTRYEKPPIGIKSDTIKLTCSVLTLPSEALTSYRSILSKVGINIKSYYLKDIASFETYKNKLSKENVLQINIGAKTTTCSIFFKKRLSNTFKITIGSDDMTKALESQLDLSTEEAENLKIKFGSALVSKCDNTIVYNTKSKKKNPLITDSMIATVIEDKLNQILSSIKEQADAFVSYGDYQIALIGGGSALRYIEEKVNNYFNVKANLYIPEVLGIRNGSLTSLYGLLELSKDDSMEIDAYSTRENDFSKNKDENLNVDIKLDELTYEKKSNTKYFGAFSDEDFK